jgi:hypothetical protein
VLYFTTMTNHHSGKHPQQQKRQKQQQQQQKQQHIGDNINNNNSNNNNRPQQAPGCLLESLPDDVIVRIGTSVAKLCGIQDLVFLSRASKRLKKILVDSQENLTEIIRVRTLGGCSMQLPSSSPATPMTQNISTLEQLAFYEIVAGHNLLEENRIIGTIGCHNEDDIIEIFDTINLHFCLNLVVLALEKLLPRFPSFTVVLDAHCGTEVINNNDNNNSERTDAYYHGCKVHKTIRDNLSHNDNNSNINDDDMDDRFLIRPWGRRVAKRASTSEHPHGGLAQKGKGWVDVFFCLGDRDRDRSATTTSTTSALLLELPPRPEFYQIHLEEPMEYSGRYARSYMLGL